MRIKHPDTPQYLDISSSHFSYADVEHFCSASFAWTTHPYAEGVWVWLPDADEWENLGDVELLPTGISEEAIAIIEMACKMGCRFMRVDADGTTYRELKVYNWYEVKDES